MGYLDKLIRERTEIKNPSGSPHLKGESGTTTINGEVFKVKKGDAESSLVTATILDAVFEIHGIQATEGNQAYGNIEIKVDPQLLAEMFNVREELDRVVGENEELKQSNSNLQDQNRSLFEDSKDAIAMKDEMERELEQRKRRITELEQEIREGAESKTENEGIRFDEMNWISTERFFQKLTYESGIEDIINLISSKDKIDQISILRDINKLDADKCLVNTDGKITHQNIADGDSNDQQKLKRKLNSKNPNSNSIWELYKLTHDIIDEKRVIRYCLECFSKGFTLKI